MKAATAPASVAPQDLRALQVADMSPAEMEGRYHGLLEAAPHALVVVDERGTAGGLAQHIGTGIALSALQKDGSRFPIEIIAVAMCRTNERDGAESDQHRQGDRPHGHESRPAGDPRGQRNAGAAARFPSRERMR